MIKKYINIKRSSWDNNYVLIIFNNSISSVFLSLFLILFSCVLFPLQVQPSSPCLVYNTLLELYLQEVTHEQNITVSCLPLVYSPIFWPALVGLQSWIICWLASFQLTMENFTIKSGKKTCLVLFVASVDLVSVMVQRKSDVLKMWLLFFFFRSELIKREKH